jgi:hypothetical protein
VAIASIHAAIPTDKNCTEDERDPLCVAAHDQQFWPLGFGKKVRHFTKRWQ